MMAAYDPKRPRPAELSDDPAPVDALLGSADPSPRPEASTEPVRVGPSSNGTEVPVAPAPEVGTTNRAVLFAGLGVSAVLVGVLVLLRLRSRRASSANRP